MPTPIILTGASSAWPVLCLVFGGAMVAVIVATTVLALLTRPRPHAPRSRVPDQQQSAAGPAPAKRHGPPKRHALA